MYNVRDLQFQKCYCSVNILHSYCRTADTGVFLERIPRGLSAFACDVTVWLLARKEVCAACRNRFDKSFDYID
jgi:hypothetical protein